MLSGFGVCMGTVTVGFRVGLGVEAGVCTGFCVSSGAGFAVQNMLSQMDSHAVLPHIRQHSSAEDGESHCRHAAHKSEAVMRVVYFI